MKIKGPERDQIVREIREKKDELTWKQWGIYSCKVDFTMNELREFKDYIDWHCYFVYCYNGQLTNEQLIEFKDKDPDWSLIFHYRFMGEKLLRKYWDCLAFNTRHSWEFTFKIQKVSKQFRHRYNWLLEKYDDKK